MTAAYIGGLASIAPLLGRLIDRSGPRRVLSACALVFPMALGALIFAMRIAPSGMLNLAFAFAAGASFPPITVCMRTFFRQRLRDESLLGAADPPADRFDTVVSWHNPEAEYMSEKISGAINVYAEPYFSPHNYRSDSNQHWRSGCPHEELRGGGFAWLQILVHPEIWVYDGATMGLTMRAMLNAEKARRLEQLVADGIHLD